MKHYYHDGKKNNTYIRQPMMCEKIDVNGYGEQYRKVRFWKSRIPKIENPPNPCAANPVGCAALAAGATALAYSVYNYYANMPDKARIFPRPDIGRICEEPLYGSSGGGMQSSGHPPGYWDAVDGAKEWGRRNGVGPKEGKDRFHDIKGGYNGSRGDDNYGVNPNTGDVVDPDGEIIGNLDD